MSGLKGIPLSKEHKNKIRLSRLGTHSSIETKLKISKSSKGKILSKETKLKMSKSHRGKVFSKETKLKMKEAKKNYIPWNKGISCCEDTKQKLSEAQKGIKGWNWQGGKSFEEYSIDWTKTLRRSIRERDKYTCQICSIQQGDLVFDIHHRDYNKKNCNPNNLITLCRSCHAKTNYNRKYWINYFSKGVNDE